MYDLTDDEIMKIRGILKDHFPKSRILIFGSRQKGTNKKHSDLDIAIDDREKIDWQNLESAKESFMNSSLRIRVELVDFNSISNEFREIILENCSVLSI